MKSDLAIGRDLFPVLRETHKLKQFRFADLMIIRYCFMDQSAQMTLILHKLLIGQQITKRKQNREEITLTIEILCALHRDVQLLVQG